VSIEDLRDLSDDLDVPLVNRGHILNIRRETIGGKRPIFACLCERRDFVELAVLQTGQQ